MKPIALLLGLGLIFVACAPRSTLPPLKWPVTGKIGEVWDINIQKVGGWKLAITEPVEGAQEDGIKVPGGYTTGFDKRVGYFEYFEDDDYLALWLDGTKDYYGCYIERRGLKGNTLSGDAVKGILYQDPKDLESPCTVTLQKASAAALRSVVEKLRAAPGATQRQSSLHGGTAN